MKQKILLPIGLLFVALALGIVNRPGLAAALTYDVEIQNKNPNAIELTFVGLYVHQFEVPPGKSTVQLERGPFQHSYYGCGQLNFGSLVVKLKDNYLEIEDCNKGGGGPGEPDANESLVTIISRSNKTLQVILLGQDTYVLDVPPGKSSYIVNKGLYQLSYYDCGLLNVTDNFNARKDTEFRIKNCSEPDEPVTDPDARTVNVRNHTYNTFTMNVFGVDNGNDYNLEVKPGPQKFQLGKGLYSFSYFACGELHFGSLIVNNRGGQIDIYSCSSPLNGQSVTNTLVTFKLKNNSDGTVILQLNGNVDYLFAVQDGGEFLVVEKGFYQYTIWACGTTYEGVINITFQGTILRTPYCSNSQ